MEPTNLILVCTLAFGVVFAVLAILACVIALVTRLFPEYPVADDSAMLAAIAGTVASALPGARVTRIEEES